MTWVVEIHEDFVPLYALPEEVRVELLAKTSLLETYGFKLGRPADTLNGYRYANMKELRIPFNPVKPSN